MKYGHAGNVFIELLIALVIDQVKSFPLQAIGYWVVMRRLSFMSITEGFGGKWDDQFIIDGGSELSLFALMRFKVKQFVENKIVDTTILVMTVILCVVIFTELALQEQIEDQPMLEYIFKVINLILLQFFIIEIVLKTFGQWTEFLYDFINVFDSIIVIASYVLLVLDLRIAIVGLLRVMRLIKVISGMKRVVDDRRAREEEIKAQKKQSATISTYVERVVEFLEKQT